MPLFGDVRTRVGHHGGAPARLTRGRARARAQSRRRLTRGVSDAGISESGSPEFSRPERAGGRWII